MVPAVTSSSRTPASCHPRRLGRVLAVLVTCIVASLVDLTGQQPTFKSSTTSIEVDVIVRDAAGRFVPDLALSDFELFEDGVRQSIDSSYVVQGRSPGGPAAAAQTPSEASARSADIQRVFVLAFDEGHMSAGSVVRAKQAALAFLSNDFTTGDIGGVVSKSRMVGGRLTSVRGDLEEAVKAVQPSDDTRSRARTMEDWPQIVNLYEALRAEREDHDVVERIIDRACAADPNECAGAAGRDLLRRDVITKGQRVVAEARIAAQQTLSTLDRLVAALAPLPGRKTVIYLSDGFFSEELAGQLQSVISRAGRGNVRVYALDTRGLNRGSADSRIVEASTANTVTLTQFDVGADGPNSLAVDTGGLLLRNTNEFSKALHEIAEDTSAYYVLGYRPTNAGFDGGFRSLKVRVTRPGLTVRARRGYLATPVPAVAPPAPESGRTDLPSTTPAALMPRYVVAPPTSAPEAPLDAAVTRLRPAGIDGAALAPASSSTTLPPELGRQLSEGWAAYQRGDTTAARNVLVPVCAHPAAPPWAHYVLGWASFADGEFSDARAQWRTVRDAVPSFEPVYFDLADSYLQLRDATRALETLKDAARQWPDDVELLNAVGVVDTSLGAFADAAATFRRALTVRPGDLMTTFNAARTHEISYAASVRKRTASEAELADAIAAYRAVAKDPGQLGDLAREALNRVAPLDVTRIRWSPAAAVAFIPPEMVAGRPDILAWSSDGQQLYLRVPATRKTPETHLLISASDGRVTPIPSQPEWVSRYWSWKSASAAPWVPSRQLRAGVRQTDPAFQDGFRQFINPEAGKGAERTNILMLDRETIAEGFKSDPFTGERYSWSPFALGALLYVTGSGNAAIIDSAGHRRDVPESTRAWLPAWSENGDKIAYLRQEKGGYSVTVVALRW